MFTRITTVALLTIPLAACTPAQQAELPAESMTPDTLASAPALETTTSSPAGSTQPQPEHSTATDTATDTAPPQDCHTMGAQAAYESGIDTIPAWHGHDWVLSDFSNFRPCDELTWLTLGIEDGTASSPYHIMLFHYGHYIGTATQEPQGFYPSVTRKSSSEIAVTYRWPREGEANANPTGTTEATFRWDDAQNKVVMTGDVPQH